MQLQQAKTSLHLLQKVRSGSAGLAWWASPSLRSALVVGEPGAQHVCGRSSTRTCQRGSSDKLESPSRGSHHPLTTASSGSINSGIIGCTSTWTPFSLFLKPADVLTCPSHLCLHFRRCQFKHTPRTLPTHHNTPSCARAKSSVCSSRFCKLLKQTWLMSPAATCSRKCVCKPLPAVAVNEQISQRNFSSARALSGVLYGDTCAAPAKP